MPTYQYKREDGTMFEIMQKISDEALKSCPETGQKVKRVITGGGGVVYKGSGWYVTDYKNRSANGARDTNGGTNGNTNGNGKASGAGTESASGSTGSKASTEGKANGNGAAASASDPASSSPSRKSGR